MNTKIPSKVIWVVVVLALVVSVDFICKKNYFDVAKGKAYDLIHQDNKDVSDNNNNPDSLKVIQALSSGNNTSADSAQAYNK